LTWSEVKNKIHTIFYDERRDEKGDVVIKEYIQFYERR